MFLQDYYCLRPRALNLDLLGRPPNHPSTSGDRGTVRWMDYKQPELMRHGWMDGQAESLMLDGLLTNR